MKGENYLFFKRGGAVEATDRCFMFPSSSVRGLTVGAVAGTTDDDLINIYFEGLDGTGNSAAVASCAIDTNSTTPETLVASLDDTVAAINSNPGDGFVVMSDSDANKFASPHYTGSIGCDSVL